MTNENTPTESSDVPEQNSEAETQSDAESTDEPIQASADNPGSESADDAGGSSEGAESAGDNAGSESAADADGDGGSSEGAGSAESSDDLSQTSSLTSSLDGGPQNQSLRSVAGWIAAAVVLLAAAIAAAAIIVPWANDDDDGHYAEGDYDSRSEDDDDSRYDDGNYDSRSEDDDDSRYDDGDYYSRGEDDDDGRYADGYVLRGKKGDGRFGDGYVLRGKKGDGRFGDGYVFPGDGDWHDWGEYGFEFFLPHRDKDGLGSVFPNRDSFTPQFGFPKPGVESPYGYFEKAPDLFKDWPGRAEYLDEFDDKFGFMLNNPWHGFAPDSFGSGFERFDGGFEHLPEDGLLALLLGLLGNAVDSPDGGATFGSDDDGSADGDDSHPEVEDFTFPDDALSLDSPLVSLFALLSGLFSGDLLEQWIGGEDIDDSDSPPWSGSPPLDGLEEWLSDEDLDALDGLFGDDLDLDALDGLFGDDLDLDDADGEDGVDGEDDPDGKAGVDGEDDADNADGALGEV